MSVDHLGARPLFNAAHRGRFIGRRLEIEFARRLRIDGTLAVAGPVALCQGCHFTARTLVLVDRASSIMLTAEPLSL